MAGTINIGGRDFPLADQPPTEGRLMVVARAERRGPKHSMVAYLDLLESMLGDHDEAEFEDAIVSLDADAIRDVLLQAAEMFKVDPSLGGRTSSSDSDSGPQPPAEPPTSKVVSFSRGTVEVTPMRRSSTG